MTNERRLVVDQWIKKAEQDLLVAVHTLTISAGECPYEIVAFHAQQGAEKYLKAVLVARGAEVPKTHDLELIMGKIEATAGEAPKVEAGTLDQLNPFSVKVRYPDDMASLQPEDAKAALASARLVRDAVRVLLQGAGMLVAAQNEGTVSEDDPG